MHCEWLTQFATAAKARRLRAIDLIIGCSDYITERIKTRFPTIAARCHTVDDGVDTERFCPASNLPGPKGGLARILYVGRLSPEKGIHVLIQASKILADGGRARQLQLDLIGHAGARNTISISLPTRMTWRPLRHSMADDMTPAITAELDGKNHLVDARDE